MNAEQEISLFDETNPFEKVFNESQVTYQEGVDEYKQMYWLRRHIINSFRKAELPNRLAKEYAARYVRDILERAKVRQA